VRFLFALSIFANAFLVGVWIQNPSCEPVLAKIARAERIIATHFRLIAEGVIRNEKPFF
jgi:hypothetical protein